MTDYSSISDRRDHDQATKSPGFGFATVDTPISLTHQHIIAVINTELVRRGPTKRAPIRLLDAGCGDGLLLAYLAKSLAACWPNLQFEFFGFDVADHGVQRLGYFAETINFLATGVPSQPWSERLALISEHDQWPYEVGFFDVVVSNQVLEHVSDHRLFFSEIARVMRIGGFSVHLFPLGHCIREPHLRLPFVHWFKSADAISACIRFYSRIGIGKFHRTATDRAERARQLDQYIEQHTDYLIRLTNYVKQSEALRYAKDNKLHASFGYTAHYYQAKLRSILGLRSSLVYRRPRAICATAPVLMLRYVASVTLLLEKEESYTNGIDP